jgi:hypothetical protein
VLSAVPYEAEAAGAVHADTDSAGGLRRQRQHGLRVSQLHGHGLSSQLRPLHKRRVRRRQSLIATSSYSVLENRVALCELVLLHYPLVDLVQRGTPLLLQRHVSTERHRYDLARHEVLRKQVLVDLHAIELVVDQRHYRLLHVAHREMICLLLRGPFLHGNFRCLLCRLLCSLFAHLFALLEHRLYALKLQTDHCLPRKFIPSISRRPSSK